MVGNVLALEGRLREAADYFQRVIAEAGARRGYAIHAMIRLALVLYEWNELEAAEAELTRATAEAQLVLIMVAQRYRLTLAPGQVVEPQVGLTLSPRGACQ